LLNLPLEFYCVSAKFTDILSDICGVLRAPSPQAQIGLLKFSRFWLRYTRCGGVSAYLKKGMRIFSRKMRKILRLKFCYFKVSLLFLHKFTILNLARRKE